MKRRKFFFNLPLIGILSGGSLLFAPESLQCAETVTCDVCVVGGGSGGFGSALAAAWAGAKVVLVEKQGQLGGTSTSAFVANWEPGPGCSLSKELYERLQKTPEDVAIAPRTHSYSNKEPYGMAVGGKKALTYNDTLKRAGVPRNKICSVAMKPKALAKAMGDMLKEAKVKVMLNTLCRDVKVADGMVQQVKCVGADGKEIIIKAKVFIDATGGAFLCRKAGCETMLGIDPRSRFDEPSAPLKPKKFLNAISLCYRIQKSADPKTPQKLSKPVGGFNKSAFLYGLDEKELIVNPLGLVPGITLIDRGYEKTMELARERVLAHWLWLHKYPHFKNYELVDIAPMLGIRESYRVVTDYVLKEQDIRAGLKKQGHDDIIAIADHALDIHGGSHGAKEVKGPYGIPYRCLIPKNTKNLLVACRGAGFSHIAASSCRLERTMTALGHAAGIAAAEAVNKNGNVRKINVEKLVKTMGVAEK